MHHDIRPRTHDSGGTAGSLQRPVFIAGAGRSGTTLLRSLLSAHPRICVSPETHYMARAEKWGFRDRDAPLDFERFWSRYTASVRFRDLGVDADYCRRPMENYGPPTFRSLFEAVLTAYGQRVDKPRIGEKTPGHVLYITDLLSWFPDARILILRRDPRAVVASQMRSPWVKERLTPTSRMLAGPHGAGLTNMLFCPPGAHVVEIADLSFPNPNFYALASGLGHHYWILGGETAGHGHPLVRDFRIDIPALDALLQQLENAAPGAVPASAPRPYMNARLS